MNDLACRKYYLTVLKQELDTTGTYTKLNSTETNIVERNIAMCKELKITVSPDQNKLPFLYWLPKLHKTPYKTRFIANPTNTTTSNISNRLTSCLTEIKAHVNRYCSKVYENSGLNLNWSVKNSGEVLTNLCSKGEAYQLSTYDFSTLYTTLPHDLIKSKLTSLIEKTFAREKSILWHVTTSMPSLQIQYMTSTPCGHVKKYVLLWNF